MASSATKSKRWFRGGGGAKPVKLGEQSAPIINYNGNIKPAFVNLYIIIVETYLLSF